MAITRDRVAALWRGITRVRKPPDLWRLRELRYLVVGGLNTLVGYGLGVGLYLVLSPLLHILAIGVLGNLLAITFSFTTYKLLVFKTRGYWLTEYLKSYVVYGGSSVLGIMVLWLLVDGLALSIWLAQALAVLIVVMVSYLGHARFTFRRAPCGPADG